MSSASVISPAPNITVGSLRQPPARPTPAGWLTETTAASLLSVWLLAVVPRKHRALAGQLLRYGVVGGICTAVYSGLYLVLASPLGIAIANTVAMIVAAVLNTTLNRRHTFRAGGEGAVRHHAQGMVILALNWLLSTGSLAGLRMLIPAAAHLTELLVLTGANLGGTLMRFILLKTWVFRHRRESGSQS